MVDLTRRRWLSAAAITTAATGVPLAAASAAPAAPEPGSLQRFDVRNYHAVGDGQTVNTIAIQKAIDACSAAGGGRVVLDGGAYITGTIYLKSNVILYIEAGSSLMGSPAIADYATDTHHNMYAGEPHMDRCLIFARDAENIGLEGRGAIDGQGKRFPNAGDAAKNRPMLIRFMNCRNIGVRDIVLRAPAAWTSAWLYCSDIHVDGISIVSRANINGDGLDFDGCENVRVSNCTFDNSDDSICLQASLPEHPCRNVVITNCVMTSRWAAIRIGLLSRGDLRDIAVSNCVFHDMTEGGRMENLVFSNIVMRNVARPVFVTLNSFPMRVDSPGGPPPIQTLRNLSFSNIQIEAATTVQGPQHSFISISGVPGHPVENVAIDNVRFTAPGGGSTEHAARRVVPEFTGQRPESRVLAPALPSYGLYARHVRGLAVSNLSLDTATPDARPGIVCDDVADLRLSGVTISGVAGAEHLVRLQNVTTAFITGCAPRTDCAAFVAVEGAGSANIALAGNDLRRAGKAAAQASDVPKGSVVVSGNIPAH